MTIIKEKILEVKSKNSLENQQSKQKIDSLGRSYSTGKRKNAVAKVWIKNGSGKITINNIDAKLYLGREILFNISCYPFEATKNTNKFDVVAQVNGGGKSGQAGALAHGISKALVLFDPSNHQLLRTGGFLTRDSRVVERKKYGLKKARKAQTYRKR
ncbi:MAG: 30S ribosomal protein S9 [Rickettsiales bacterium]|jgi:small subunit ribosomal protein S9|nr:30S ribosomal protein S9 [Rickettsiales bacterium]